MKMTQYMPMSPPLQPGKTGAASLACVVAATLWGLFWYPLRLLEGMGWHGLWSALALYCVASVAIALPVWRGRDRCRQNWPGLALLGLFAGGANLAFILAVLEGEVVRVLLLFYLSPVWAILLARLILQERLARTGALALVIAMTGAVLMLWQADSGAGRGLNPADLYALAAGLCFALSNIVVRGLAAVPLDLKIGAAYAGVIALALIAIIAAGIAPPMVTANSALLVLLLGCPLLYVMMWTAQYGVTHLPIQRSSILFLLEIVAGALSAAWLTDETLTRREYLGGVLVVSAGLLSVFGRRT